MSGKRIWLKKLIEESEYDRCRQALADRIGVHISYIGKMESGQRTPSVQTAMKLGEVLEFEWTRFFDEEKKGA